MKFRKEQSGFTIVELLIVIIVIGILAGLVITTFTGIQQKGRNTERQTDIKALHGQLEAYFAQNGKYPTLGNMNDQTASTGFLAKSMKGLDKDALYDPRGDTSDTSPLADNPAADVYAYEPKDSTGAEGCTNATTATECVSYVLTATNEGGGTFVKNSLN